MEALPSPGPGPFFLDIPFNKRWEFLKPTIKRFYIDEDQKLPKVMQLMKEEYHFDAEGHQYKHHFKKWAMSKSVPKAKTEAAISAIGKRKRETTSTPVIRYHGEEIDKRKMRRLIKSQEKQQNDLQISSNMFTRWNLPYQAFKSLYRAEDPFSPFKNVGSTPSDLSITSPPFLNPGQSPRGAPSPMTVPSPTMLAISGKILNDRARLLILGKHEDLFGQLERYERKILTTWLHQFWIFSFKTAKHWGRGPRQWTADMLAFDQYKDKASPATPRIDAESPLNQDAHRPHNEKKAGVTSMRPSALCHWSIHIVVTLKYEKIASPRPEATDDFDIENESSWKPWPQNVDGETFTERLQSALRNNQFSCVEAPDLPIAATQITKATERSPERLLIEAILFSIMARNSGLLYEHIEHSGWQDDMEFPPEMDELFPFHLATSYMDGSKSCCDILDELVMCFPLSLRKLSINDFGHTLLDNLFIVILKCHTSCPPVTVADRFRNLTRFAGEEVDICGRWDADSSCVRALLAEGKPAIPFQWKHMFCHTSIQTICHSIGQIFGPSGSPDVNTPSGLFEKLCMHCGQKLQLGPLHSLVTTAFHLARSGCRGETLFGMLACLVCLLVNGADPLGTAHISIKALLGVDRADECSHKELNPAELAEQVPTQLVSTWTEEVQLGWKVLYRTLKYAQEERNPKPSRAVQSQSSRGRGTDDIDVPIQDESDVEMIIDEYSSDDEIDCLHYKEHSNFYAGSEDIGSLWAAIQTELLTYRRRSEGDPWISSNFSMLSLLDGLESGKGIDVTLVNDNMMKPFCRCGRFIDASHEACATVPEVCKHYFSNMEEKSDVHRRNYIGTPDPTYNWYG